MNILNFILLLLGISVFISLLVYFTIVEIKSSVFHRLGFVGNKEDLYNITFQKFDFDYSLVSGTDNNENQEQLINKAIKQINTQYTPTMNEIDYYE